MAILKAAISIICCVNVCYGLFPRRNKSAPNVSTTNSTVSKVPSCEVTDERKLMTLRPVFGRAGTERQTAENIRKTAGITRTDSEHSQPANKLIAEQPNWLLLLAASVNTLLIVLSLFLNLFIVTYYWSTSSNLSSLLYLRNGIADCISAIGFLLQVPLVIRVLEEDLPSSLPLISYWITTVSVRMSVFMNCVLGVVRCINILSPFYQVNEKYVTISTLLYLLTWSTISSLDVWLYTSEIGLQNKVYLIRSLVLKTETGFSLTSLAGSVNHTLTSFSQGEVVAIQFLAPLALPALLCFVLMLFQVYHLTRQVGIMSNQPRPAADEEEGKKKATHNHRAAVTILIVTTVYVLTAILSVAIWLVVFRTHLGKKEKIKKLSWTELGLIYISSSTLHLLSSTITALTLLLRSSAMQQHLKNTYRETIRSLSGNDYQFNRLLMYSHYFFFSQ